MRVAERERMTSEHQPIMTGTTIVKSGEFPENTKTAPEADRRAAAARPQQGLMLATTNLSRAVGDKMLVRDVSIQVSLVRSWRLWVRAERASRRSCGS
jgi:hypothetical protein